MCGSKNRIGEIEKTMLPNNNRTVPPIKCLPEDERPYEKCWNRGERALSDAELLSVILRTGVTGESALDLSRRIVMELGREGLSGLYHLSTVQLMQIRGVGRVKAAQLKCIGELSRRIAGKSLHPQEISFNDPETVALYYMEEYRHEECEKVLLIMLDTRGHLLGEEVIASGTVDQSLISPREVFLSALRRRSVNIILLHNHPSGDPTPSEQDILITQRIREGGELLGIELLDHIIIGDRKCVSFRRENLL